MGKFEDQYSVLRERKSLPAQPLQHQSADSDTEIDTDSSSLSLPLHKLHNQSQNAKTTVLRPLSARMHSELDKIHSLRQSVSHSNISIPLTSRDDIQSSKSIIDSDKENNSENNVEHAESTHIIKQKPNKPKLKKKN